MDERNNRSEMDPHQYLSAPWRMQYLDAGSRVAGCVFCTKLESHLDVENLVLWRGASVAIMMNLFPYSTGHIMIIPYEHTPSPETILDPHILQETASAIPSSMRALRRVLDCQGFNTGMNTGSVAGAGIADHMHMHIVPRWGGDANFMPIIAKVTVMPEVLTVTYAKLRAELTVEHDQSSALNLLILSPDRASVFSTPDARSAGLPTVHSDLERSVVAEMKAILREIDVDASIGGWVGSDTVIWVASQSPRTDDERWTSIESLPEPARELALQAINHLSKTD